MHYNPSGYQENTDSSTRAKHRSLKKTSTRHLPDKFDDIMKLSEEYKVLLGAAAASGCDAAAYYVYHPRLGYCLDKYIDLYRANTTFFPSYLEDSEACGIYNIPIRTVHGRVKGIVALHAPDNAFNRKESYYHRSAKLNMAHYLLERKAYVFCGADGKQCAKPVDADDKNSFFMRIVRDMFFTLSSFGDAVVEEVQLAQNAQELKEAFRRAITSETCIQHQHVIGVADLMDYTASLAINADSPILDKQQTEIITLLSLVHDLGKTQMPTYVFRKQTARDVSIEEDEYEIARNGNHPLFTLLILLPYEREAMIGATHHHGLKRYGAAERKRLKERGRVRANFNDFTQLKGRDTTISKLSIFSRLLRVADVGESITGSADLPLHEAVYQMANQVQFDAKGHAVINPDTIDPESLCFMITTGVFDAYGKQKAGQNNGWMSNRPAFAGQSKYDAGKLEEICQKTLERFGWNDPETCKAKQDTIRKAIASEKL